MRSSGQLHCNYPTKRILWPRPKFRDEIRGGLNTPKHAVLFMLVYDNLSNKPLTDGWFNLSKKTWEQAYILSINYIKDVYENQHCEDIESLRKGFNSYISSKFPNPKDDIERYAAGRAVRNRVTHPLTLTYEAKIRLQSLVALGWGDDEDILDTDNYGACLLTDSRSKKDSWHAVKGITAKSVTTLDNWKKYPTFSAAMEQARIMFESDVLMKRKNTPKEKKERAKPPKRPYFDREYIRQGPDYRKGESVSVEQFMNTFRFRGIEFGNWVTQSERQGFLDATFDALMDLVSIFGLPPTFASLGGTLGIAFGSRGKGTDGVAAHFELDQWLIHLTKTKGVGALCHEFAHSVDAYLAKRNKTRTLFFSENFLNGIKGHRTYVVDKRKNLQSIKDHAMLDEYLNLMNSMVYKKADAHESVNTTYAEHASRSDRLQKKGYWSDPTEMFARALETWMSDQLVMNGQINEFLVYGTDQPPASWNTKLNMYPESNEREAIVKAMDNWVISLVDIWKSPKK